MTLSLAGRRFGRLVVMRATKERSGKSIVWLCHCDCGNKEAKVAARDLLHNPRKGCGYCSDTKHPLYGIWRGIIERCKPGGDKNYGGRGIQIFPAWETDFLAFLDFMKTLGPRPPGWSLDRIDVNGHYEPGNLRWASPLMQANNKRDLPRGLTDEQIWEIYLSKEPEKILRERHKVAAQTIKNIRCLGYSEKATQLCLHIPKEIQEKFSRKISGDSLAKLRAKYKLS